MLVNFEIWQRRFFDGEVENYNESCIESTADCAAQAVV
jgi:hypothetical protein